jgi:transposase
MLTPRNLRSAIRVWPSKPDLVDPLRMWLETKLAVVSGRSKIAEAIRYGLSRWDGLARFLDDGRIEIDGSDGGGEHWAVVASLIETCKINGVDPYAYMRDVLTKIVPGIR